MSIFGEEEALKKSKQKSFSLFVEKKIIYEMAEIEKAKIKRKRTSWSDTADELFISLWDEKLPDLRGPRKNSHVLEEISQAMLKEGFSFTSGEIKAKIHNFTSKYRQEKKNVGTTGGSPSNWKHYNRIHQMLGSFKINNTEEIIEESTGILKLAAIGVTLLTVAALTVVVDPVQIFVDSQMALRSGSLLYNLWLKPPLEVFITVYMFNITNVNAYMTGADSKIKVEEVGPYVYQEVLENVNVSFNENNTVSYNPMRTLKFIRERSVGDPKVDNIVAPNVPYMGVTSAASSFSRFAALAISALTKKLGSKAILNMPIHDYLWGHDDRLVHLASRFVPSVIKFQRFGLMERIFDEGHNLVTMTLPKRQMKHADEARRSRDFSIDNWNGKKGIKYWDYREDENNTVCNTVSGAYDATLFPRDIEKGETFRIYRKAFCRTLPITFTSSEVYDGIEGYRFTLPLNAFDSDVNDPTTSCFCKGNRCLKRGLGNVTPCYYNIPLAISFPHFMGADPTLSEHFEGLYPDESKHGTEIVIQPQLGIPMRVHSRFQINLLMGDIKYNADMERFRNMAFPVFWLEIGVDQLTPGLILLMKLLFSICPYTQLAFIVMLVIAGVSMICTALIFCFYTPEAWTTLATAMVHTRNLEGAKLANVCILPLLTQQPLSTDLQKLHPKRSKGKPLYDVTLLPLQRNIKPGNDK